MAVLRDLAAGKGETCPKVHTLSMPNEFLRPQGQGDGYPSNNASRRKLANGVTSVFPLQEKKGNYPWLH